MKNPKGIFSITVALVLLAIAIAAAVATYIFIRRDTSTNNETNANVLVNTNTIVVNTNTVANLNTPTNSSSNQNVNSASSIYPKQEWPGEADDSVLFQTYTSGSTDTTVYSIVPGQEAKKYFTPPTGYSVIENSRGRLIWLEKDDILYLYDTRDGSVRKTSLPVLLAGNVRYESAGPLVYSTDGVELIVRYSLFDKNSDAYKNEFAGPQPISSKQYRYNITADTYSAVENFDGIFYTLWDRGVNIGYNHLSGEGVGSKTPITKSFFETGKSEQSADYGNNSNPAFSQDGKWVAVPAVEKSPFKVHIFALPDISKPAKTFTLANVKDADPVTNALGYVYDFEWTADNENLILSFGNSMYAINVETNSATRIFTNAGTDASYTGWSYYPVVSGSGRYVYYVDNGNSNPANLKNENNIHELKMYDMQTRQTKTLKKVTGETNISLIGGYN